MDGGRRVTQQELGLGEGFCWPNKFGVYSRVLLELDFLRESPYLAMGV